MTLEARIAEAEQKFNIKDKERQEHLKLAEECLTELTKLQGEWRVLQDLIGEKNSSKVTKKATVIEAVPEETK